MERLTELFIHRAIPDCIRSDNGSEFTAKAVRAWLYVFDVKTLFISPRHRIDKIGQQAVGGGAGAEVCLDER